MSYDTSLGTPKDQVRFLIGDTNTADEMLSDAEIAFCLTTYDNDIYQAARLCCTSLAAKYAKDIDSDIETVSEKASQKFKHYNELSTSIRQAELQTKAGAAPIIAGNSISEINSVRQDTDRPLSEIRPDRFDNDGPYSHRGYLGGN